VVDMTLVWVLLERRMPLTCLECLDRWLESGYLGHLRFCFLRTALEVLDIILAGIKLFLPLLKLCTRTLIV
jgi:hypothetical protein